MTITEAETQVRTELGTDCVPVKLSGTWFIHRYESGKPVAILGQSRSLSAAIQQAKAV